MQKQFAAAAYKMNMNNIIKATILLQIISLQLFSQQGEWTWMNGNSAPGSTGVFGTQGTPDPNNTPPAFYEACEWTDLQGNFWLFGGYGVMGNWYNDLWKYDVTTNEWTWINGPGIPNQIGSYGTQGVPSASNIPSSRCEAFPSWTDSNGNLWLFGGHGYDATGASGKLSDLWKYDISTNEWTWMKGSNICDQTGTYGTITVSDPANCPGSRDETSCSWIVNDELWFFGGTTNGGNHNDLWKYNISTNEWTWMKGSSMLNQLGIYGTQGVSNPVNTPGARWIYTRWKDNSNNLWLWGGYGYSTTWTQGHLNDLWKYDISTNEWTWIGGSNTIEDAGNYGTKCVSSVNYLPPSRCGSRSCWTDDCGNFWLFGGYTMPTSNLHNDLWVYEPTTNKWKWVSGSSSVDQPGIYGTKGVSSPTNMPGGRCGSDSWIDVNGNLWLFGGYAYSWLNDLWRYVIDPSCSAISGLQITVSNDTTICEGSNAIITAGGATDYIWSNGSTDASITVSPSNTITYTVTGMIGSCSGTDEIIVTVYSLPTVNAGNDTVICTGTTATITATGASDYEWNTTSTNASITVSPQNKATYTVTGSNGPCSETDEIVITVYPLPTVNLGTDTCILSGVSYNLSVNSGFDDYLWHNGSSGNTFTVNDSGVYYVKITDTCGIVSDTINISICTNLAIFIPNVFTPDGDGTNDFFKPIGNNIEEFEMYIFDRWGQLIFETTDINTGWNGKYKNEICPEGIYTWVIFYRGSDDISNKKYGHVALLK